ncbi:Y+L amino acid transporter 2 [Contarinia nasturtii]|uniref:Y+L amino acid transporter 2 n=1 Tax=Contarinia nasturtii TaxID=265458 RepID=UPI0012D49BE6|nr:Y+L amino acid transporter 2 [Contarinia nasturtii]XP_031626370.1 Y+L amino acid transporter 2 [Contarinia nasturtii]XP_031626379.1 Y+L amino acid transporter 2 [Contarinia nasturtii]XP_031626386.1 Y+L amino acid transporter 2 [Contarinia nasturtii]XP_031626394.1 Y+L amino acid transporter 2 [Contarinia nasturtii]
MARVSSSDSNAPPKTGFGDSGSKKLERSGSENGVQLKKELGLLDGVAIIVGVIIGAGIFVSPKGVLDHSGSIGQAIIVWILSGILSMVGALCYAELGTMIPRSGGDYAYIGVAFGPLPAFLYLWVALLILVPTGNAITAITFAQYLLQPFWPTCDAPIEAVRIFAAIITCVLTVINCYNVKWVTRVTDIFTTTKIAALLLIVAYGVWHLMKGNTEYFQEPMKGSKTEPGYIALAFYSGLFSYSGWNYLNFVTEELRDPYKNLPRAICISMPVVTIVYVITNIAYFATLSSEEILSSDAVAVTFANKMMGFIAWVMPLFVACSTFGSLNGAIFASSRLFFVGARNGHLPAAISLININCLTPIPSLILMCILTLVLLFIRDVFVLIYYVSYVEALFTLISISGLLWMRRTHPNAKRPIRVNILVPLTYLLTCSFLVISSIYQSPAAVGIATLITMTGIPIYYITIHRPIPFLTKVSHNINMFCAKLFLCVPNQEKFD